MTKTQNQKQNFDIVSHAERVRSQALLFLGFRISNFPKVVKRLSYYFRIWLMMSKNSFMIMLSHKLLFATFLFGKLLRFGFFAAFLFFLVKGADSLAGYNISQTIFFFLTFNVVDILAQFLYREVYRFRPLVVSGDLDLVLTKPMSVLFRVLMGGIDVIDLVTIPPLIAAVIYVGGLLNPSTPQILFYAFLIINGLLIATAFHIAVLSLGIITLEIDHTIMIYRDVSNLGRLPVDIYRQPLRGVLTYLIPVGIMITLPAKALMGLVTPTGILLSFALGGVLIFASMRFWNFALKHYTSASS
jgi:ABC-2 type transport system permease protein